MKLSLVVPCYNEEGNIRAFYTEAKRVFDAEDYEYEIIFVNDGSKTATTVIPTPAEADEILFHSDGKAVINVEKYDIVL